MSDMISSAARAPIISQQALDWSGWESAFNAEDLSSTDSWVILASTRRRSDDPTKCDRWATTRKCEDNTCKLDDDYYEKHDCNGSSRARHLQCTLCFSSGQTDTLVRPNKQLVRNHCCSIERHAQITLTVLGSLLLGAIALSVAMCIIKDIVRKSRRRRAVRKMEKDAVKAINGQTDGASGVYEFSTRSCGSFQSDRSSRRVPVMKPAIVDRPRNSSLPGAIARGSDSSQPKVPRLTVEGVPTDTIDFPEQDDEISPA